MAFFIIQNKGYLEFNWLDLHSSIKYYLFRLKILLSTFAIIVELESLLVSDVTDSPPIHF